MASTQQSAASRQQCEVIPFNRPFVSGKEYAYIQEAIGNGHISGDGPFTKRCESLLEEVIGCERALLTTSCTDALEMSALLLDVKPGDEVIVPSFTFVSTVNSFVLRGAVPRFIDIRPDTLNLDESKLEELITPATKAIVAVHYAGVGCEMDAIMDVASGHGITVVEDNAHGLFGRYRGRNLGTLGALATLSFYETKNISCGEGGALLINNSDYIDRAEILREKGTDRTASFEAKSINIHGLILDRAFSLRTSLRHFCGHNWKLVRQFKSIRRRIWWVYVRALEQWAAKNAVQLPVIPPDRDQSYHMLHLLMPSATQRDGLIAHLRKHGIHSVFHYVPLHQSEMGRRAPAAACPITEDASSRLIRLPFFNGLTEQDQLRVVDAVLQFHV